MNRKNQSALTAAGGETPEQLQNPYVLQLEADHFQTCGTCGQAFDRRYLGVVLYHELPDHPPMRRN